MTIQALEAKRTQEYEVPVGYEANTRYVKLNIIGSVSYFSTVASYIQMLSVYYSHQDQLNQPNRIHQKAHMTMMMLMRSYGWE